MTDEGGACGWQGKSEPQSRKGRRGDAEAELMGGKIPEPRKARNTRKEERGTWEEGNGFLPSISILNRKGTPMDANAENRNSQDQNCDSESIFIRVDSQVFWI